MFWLVRRDEFAAPVTGVISLIIVDKNLCHFPFKIYNGVRCWGINTIWGMVFAPRYVKNNSKSRRQSPFIAAMGFQSTSTARCHRRKRRAIAYVREDEHSFFLAVCWINTPFLVAWRCKIRDVMK